MSTRLYVVMNGQLIGDVEKSGTHRIRFRYALDDPTGYTPLSVSMPGPRGRYREHALSPWLEGLLPDRPATVSSWRRQFGLPANADAYDLLHFVGEDVQGAAQFVREERLEAVLAGGEGALIPMTDEQVAAALRRAQADLPVTSGSGPEGKFSLAGAQAKLAVHKTEDGWANPSGVVPSTCIIKPAMPTLKDQDLVEAVTMKAARLVGLNVAAVELAMLADARALVVHRYDRLRLIDGTWVRVHQEDMNQALGLPPHKKYQSQGGASAAEVAALLREHSSAPETDQHDLVRALLFNWLICGTDAHARNFSLLLSGDQVRLAPLYDLNSYLAYDQGAGLDLSMSVQGFFRASLITPQMWASEAYLLGVSPEWIVGEIQRLAAEIPAAFGNAASQLQDWTATSAVIDRLLENVSRRCARWA